jgi:hypothetical protein
MKTIDEYAVDLVAAGAESFAEDDLNESDEITDENHEEACDLAVRMAQTIRENPEAFHAWCGTIWDETPDEVAR